MVELLLDAGCDPDIAWHDRGDNYFTDHPDPKRPRLQWRCDDNELILSPLVAARTAHLSRPSSDAIVDVLVAHGATSPLDRAMLYRLLGPGKWNELYQSGKARRFRHLVPWRCRALCWVLQHGVEPCALDAVDAGLSWMQHEDYASTEEEVNPRLILANAQSSRHLSALSGVSESASSRSAESRVTPVRFGSHAGIPR
jgi:hypothetical protein